VKIDEALRIFAHETVDRYPVFANRRGYEWVAQYGRATVHADIVNGLSQELKHAGATVGNNPIIFTICDDDWEAAQTVQCLAETVFGLRRVLGELCDIHHLDPEVKHNAGQPYVCMGCGESWPCTGKQIIDQLQELL
jgi:hypothetical protein